MKDGVVTPDSAMIESLYEDTLVLDHLVDDLQDLALAEGELRLQCEPADPALLVEKTVAAARQSAERHGLTVRADCAAELPMILRQTERMGQVLRNLLQNALTHTPRGGEVAVACQPVSSGVEISVRDTGEGIPARNISPISLSASTGSIPLARAPRAEQAWAAIAKHWVEGARRPTARHQHTRAGDDVFCGIARGMTRQRLACGLLLQQKRFERDVQVQALGRVLQI